MASAAAAAVAPRIKTFKVYRWVSQENLVVVIINVVKCEFSYYNCQFSDQKRHN